MISMLIIFSFALLSVSESARYARFNEDYVSAFGDFASNGNVVYLGAKNKVLKLHFARRAFIAQFEVLSSMCPLGNEACSDYTQHSLIADGRTFGVDLDKVLVSCGTHGGNPRCVLRDLPLLKSMGEVRHLQFAATQHQGLSSLAKVHDNKFYYTSYITNDTSHAILGVYNSSLQLTTKIDNKWFNNAQFVSLMPIDKHMYVFYKELTFDYPSPILTSRVARVCLNDGGGNKLLLHKHFRSFTKASMTCTSPSTMAGVPDYTYSFIDGVAVPEDSLSDPSKSDRFLYAIFSNIPNGPCSASAICAYNIADVDRAFKSNEFVRIDHGHNVQHIVPSVADSCEEPRSLYDAHKYNFLWEPVRHSFKGPMYAAKCRKYTAIAADKSNGLDVLFIATSDLHFIKMAVHNGKAYQVDIFKIRKDDAPINKIVIEPTANYVLASGPDSLLRIPISQCRRFNDCNACVGSRDPYCGWCPIYDSCVATISCPQYITNYEERFETANLCFPHQRTTNYTRRDNNGKNPNRRKIKRKKRRK